MSCQNKNLGQTRRDFLLKTIAQAADTAAAQPARDYQPSWFTAEEFAFNQGGRHAPDLQRRARTRRTVSGRAGIYLPPDEHTVRHRR